MRTERNVTLRASAPLVKRNGNPNNEKGVWRMAAMETKIPPSIAYTGRVRVKVTSILFLAMMCLTGIGLAISDLSKNLIFLGQGLCAPNSKLLESMVGFHGNKGR